MFNRGFVTDIGAVIIALLVGVGVGYWYGNMSGFQAGLDSERNEALSSARESINPFRETSTNPFNKSVVNPYENIKTNPFE